MGRDPSERLDNQNHPEDTVEGVAVSLTSAAAHPSKENGLNLLGNTVREQYRRYLITQLVITPTS